MTAMSGPLYHVHSNILEIFCGTIDYHYSSLERENLIKLKCGLWGSLKMGLRSFRIYGFYEIKINMEMTVQKKD